MLCSLAPCVNNVVAEHCSAWRVYTYHVSGTSGVLCSITEFGAAMHCKYGWVGSVVEVTKPVPATSTDCARTIAMIHAGSDIFARQCYAPNMYVFSWGIHRECITACPAAERCVRLGVRTEHLGLG